VRPVAGDQTGQRAAAGDQHEAGVGAGQQVADLVVAAVQAANENAQALQQQKLGPLAQGLGGGSGSGIPGLPF